MACYQAIKYIEHHRTSTTLPCKAGPLKTDVRIDKKIHRLFKADRFKTAIDIYREISTNSDTQIKRIYELELLSQKNILTDSDQQLSNVVFTDEFKFNRFAFDEKMYIRHHIDEEYHKGCLKETIRCRSGSVLHLNPDLNPIEMLWIDMNKHVKKQELKNINELYARIEEAWCLIPITDGVDAFDLSNLCHAEYARNLQKTKLLCVIKYANT
ncbi:transposable element Tcb2 transposase [Vespula maculifrons]|uniref:Transposable element Tcb2 transposase n=1 Tax=Vespula maculifrons TaxID=7453 RepID=A0ABD2CVX0_VESMC